MKRWLGLGLLVFIGAAGWRIGDALSPDALSMATGVLFGVMAGVPTALLVMAGSRRPAREERAEEGRTRHNTHPVYMPGPQQSHAAYGQGSWPMPYAQQPPIIVVTGPQGTAGQQPQMYANDQAQAAWFPQSPPDRHFTVVGEREALIEEW